MDNDRVFTAYTLFLLAGVASVVTASVLAGVATLPTPLVFLEHIGMSLLFRAAYKSIGGYEWVFWSGPSVETLRIPSAAGGLGATADSLG